MHLPPRPHFHRRVNVTRDRLEEIAFRNRTQIHLADDIATTRIDGVEFWAELGEVW